MTSGGSHDKFLGGLGCAEKTYDIVEIADMSERKTGTVKWFNARKSYGFLSPEDGSENMFVHYTAIQGDEFLKLERGQMVEYLIEESPKGVQIAEVVSL